MIGQRPRFSNVAALTFTAMVLGDRKNVNGPRCGLTGQTTGTYECTLDPEPGAPVEQTPEQIDRAIVEACLKRARRALRRRSQP